MSLAYKAVGWNRQKKIYDTVLWIGDALYLILFSGVGLVIHPDTTLETLIIRGFGTGALLLLHISLSIGPLCRMNSRFLPLLYNRRHMGVTMFLLALVHALFSLIQFHALGNVNPLVSLLAGNTHYDSLSNFPFEILGLAALTILFFMAATSHDFWLANLTAPVWKTLHMGVYAAYALLVLHVTLGILQAETSPVFSTLLGLGFTWIIGIHLLAALRERRGDKKIPTNELVDIGHIDEIQEKCAKIVCLSGERIAIFKYDGKISAISNVCQHQNGPLGEGRIIDGCVTCPWHGYQYDPATGASPPPFTEKVPTFNVTLENGRILVDPRPNPAGTRVEPAMIGES